MKRFYGLREMARIPKSDRLWNYRQEQLSGELPMLNLPTDRPRTATQTYRGVLLQKLVMFWYIYSVLTVNSLRTTIDEGQAPVQMASLPI